MPPPDNTAIVPHQAGTADVVELQSEAVPNIAAAVAQLQKAIADMCPDDVIVEYNAEQSGGQSKTSFRLRAYRSRNP
jgi:hypothetical protein